LRRKGLVEKTFQINGNSFVMRCAGTVMTKAMTRALSHLATGQKEGASLVIDCWDITDSGVECPYPEGTTYQPGKRGEMIGLDCPEMRMAYYPWNKLANVFFPDHHRAFYCIVDANRVPVEQLAAPAYTIFSWWLATRGLQFAHTAVVGTERCGLLILGHGGAGKSTLSFSTIGSPLRYLSDDFCVLAPGEPLRALALYSSGKLSEASLCLLPHLRPHAANADDRTREKAVFFLNEKFPAARISDLPVRAMVLSHLSSFETSLSPITWREGVDILAGSTMRELAGSGQEEILRIMRMTRHLPVYRLDHGLNTADTHKLLLQLCETRI